MDLIMMGILIGLGLVLAPMVFYFFMFLVSIICAAIAGVFNSIFGRY